MAITKNKNQVITFDESTHTYRHDGKELMSVTRWINQTFIQPFDPIFPSINKSKSNKKHETGITDAVQLRRYWNLKAERASHNGTATHIFSQMYHMDKHNTIPMNGYELALKKAFDSLSEKWEIVNLEKVVYSLEYMIAGTIDLVIKNKADGRLGIVDWKTTEDMLKSYNKLLGSLNTYKDNSLNKYAIQLQTYNEVGNLDVKLEDMFIIQLKHDGTYKVYSKKSKIAEEQIIDFRPQIKHELNKRQTSRGILDIIT